MGFSGIYWDFEWDLLGFNRTSLDFYGLFDAFLVRFEL